MAITLYDLTVPSFLQTIGAIAACLNKGLAHCQAHSIDPATLVDAKLAPDMLPLRFQIVSVAHHSLGALSAVKAGQFAPPGKTPPLTYADLQKMLADTQTGLQALTAAEVNGLEGGDVTFKIGDFTLPFVAEGFLTSFSLPNFYFHASTAYDILRNQGVGLGKRDFLGQMRLKA